MDITSYNNTLNAYCPRELDAKTTAAFAQQSMSMTNMFSWIWGVQVQMPRPTKETLALLNPAKAILQPSISATIAGNLDPHQVQPCAAAISDVLTDIVASSRCFTSLEGPKVACRAPFTYDTWARGDMGQLQLEPWMAQAMGACQNIEA